MAPEGFLSKTLLLAAKDIKLEWRGRDTLLPMLVFGLAVTLLLAFTLSDPTRLDTSARLPGGAVAPADVLAGFLWITILFAGLIGFARSFELERDEGALDALLLVPLDRSGLWLSKALANLAGIVVLEALVIPLFALLFTLRLGARWVILVLVVVLVDVGFVAVGTLFAAVAAQTRSRELILPILALPALVPIFIAGVELSSDLFVGAGLDSVAASGWFGILVAFDIVAAVLGALTFEFVID
ncbi:MAG: heme exporter protein CcmB [Actinomycetota bacterium]